MDDARFDRWTQTLTDGSSRRSLLRAISGAALGLVAAQLPGVASARKKKRTATKPTLNGFGCLDVGTACGGNSDKCCSGICNGKKPKKGKTDKSRRVAHNVGNCTPEQDICTENGAASCGSLAYCYRTTGQAGFCGGLAGECAVCRKDTDCDELGFGPGAACAFCTNGCPMTGHTVCVPPAA